MKTWRVVEHIYEGDEIEPTLTHVFYGETEVRAWDVRAAHMKTDSFLRSCATAKRFRDFTCRTERHVEHFNVRGGWRRAL